LVVELTLGVDPSEESALFSCETKTVDDSAADPRRNKQNKNGMKKEKKKFGFEFQLPAEGTEKGFYCMFYYCFKIIVKVLF